MGRDDARATKRREEKKSGKRRDATDGAGEDDGVVKQLLKDLITPTAFVVVGLLMAHYWSTSPSFKSAAEGGRVHFFTLLNKTE